MLTDKQKAFVSEYLKDFNGTQAAIRAGYARNSANEQAARMLAKDSVSKIVAETLRKKANEAELSVEWVLKHLKMVAERSLQVIPVLEKVGGEIVNTGEFKFDSAGANKSLELIGKHLKMFTEKHELTGKDGGPITTMDLSKLSDADLEKLETILAKTTDA